MANKPELKVGQIWKLAEKPATGSQEVRIDKIDGDKITVHFGRMAGDIFAPRTFVDKGTRTKVSEIIMDRSALKAATFINKGEPMATKKETPAEKKAEDQVEPILKPSEKAGGKKKPSRSEAASKKTDKAAEIKDKKKADADAKRDKQKADKRAGKIKDEVKKIGKAFERTEDGSPILGEDEKPKPISLKESDLAEKFSANRTAEEGGPVKAYNKLNEAEAEQVMTYLKDLGKSEKKAVSLSQKVELKPEEQAERSQLERTVRSNMATFQKSGFEIGAALTIIQQKKLYRSTHKTFESYVQETFDLSRPYAYSVINAAQTFQAIAGPDQKFDVKQLPSIRAAEEIARGVDRIMADTNQKGTDEEKAMITQLSRNVYNLAIETAPKDKAGKPLMTPAHLQSTVEVVAEIAKTGAVEIDGKQVPLNVAQAAIGEQIAEVSAERAKRLNQYLADNIERKSQTIAAATSARKDASRLDSALNSVTGIIDIPEGVKPVCITNCTVHGRQKVEQVDFDHVTLSCFCYFAFGPEGLEWIKVDEKLKKEAEKAAVKADAAAAGGKDSDLPI